MKTKLIILLALTAFGGILFSGVCHAITITAPASVQVGRPVTITAEGILTALPTAGCNINIDFGDGSPPAVSAPCPTPPTPCGISTTHVYDAPGTYTIRAFSTGCSAGANVPDPAVQTITVVDLRLQRIELYFDNRQPQITVKQNQRDLKAFVDIRYSGSGLLQGFWEVDGRAFARVQEQLDRNRQLITLQTPVAPSLPTQAAGSHRIRFIITRPALDITFPQAIYFVTAERTDWKRIIQLTAPTDRTTIACAPVIFSWQSIEKANAYLIEFLEEGADKPTFSAYVRSAEYTLRANACRSIFTPRRPYRWRVKGIDAADRIIGESAAFTFFLTLEIQ
jgi:hypothetical protein